MISRDCIITVNGNNATIDSDIYLYKYDKNIQLAFAIINSKYMYDNDDSNNLIKSMQAAYAQVKFKKNDSTDIAIEFPIQATKKGAVLLTINEELTDEDTELGDYTIQIRLLDSNKNSVVTLPPVESCIHIQAPLFEKMGADTNEINKAIVNKAVARYAAPLSATTEDGTFNSKEWVDGDKITTAELNRMEDGIGYNNTQIKDIKSKQIVLEKDDTSMDGIEDTTHDTLTTTNKTIIGGINEVNSQIKNIASKTIDTISSKVLATVPASNIKLDDEITINNVSINKDRKYYIEFLGSKKLCSLEISEKKGPNNLSVILCTITCNIGDYTVVANSASPLNNITIYIGKLSHSGESSVTAETIPNATDLVIHEEEVKYLDNKYLETDLVLQNSISMGRVGKLAGGSTALGNTVEASGDFSHAEGDSTTASGQASHAEGGLTTASGNCSHAEGNETTASRIASHAEGSSTTASGDFSHAEGNTTIASGDNSHAEGFSTTASGINSHAEGDSTTASGAKSHAEGSHTTASGSNSHAEGFYTKASSECQHVQGKFNIEDTANKYAHIVGNGKYDNTRSNAHTLDWEGNAWYAGKLSQEGTPTEDKDLVTKKYVADKLSSLPQLSFNESGELVVTINGVSKTFVPKSEQ
jgi:hypothetical protein